MERATSGAAAGRVSSAGAAATGTSSSSSSTSMSGAGATAVMDGCSARTAGFSFFTTRAVTGLAGAGAVSTGATSTTGSGSTAGSSSTGGTSTSSAVATSSTGRAAFFTTLMARFTVTSFLGKYLLRIFSASSFETEL